MKQKKDLSLQHQTEQIKLNRAKIEFQGIKREYIRGYRTSVIEFKDEISKVERFKKVMLEACGLEEITNAKMLQLYFPDENWENKNNQSFD